jgi:hypothetical protein
MEVIDEEGERPVGGEVCHEPVEVERQAGLVRRWQRFAEHQRAAPGRSAGHLCLLGPHDPLEQLTDHAVGHGLLRFGAPGPQGAHRGGAGTGQDGVQQGRLADAGGPDQGDASTHSVPDRGTVVPERLELALSAVQLRHAGNLVPALSLPRNSTRQNPPGHGDPSGSEMAG